MMIPFQDLGNEAHSARTCYMVFTSFCTIPSIMDPFIIPLSLTSQTVWLQIINAELNHQLHHPFFSYSPPLPHVLSVPCQIAVNFPPPFHDLNPPEPRRIQIQTFPLENVKDLLEFPIPVFICSSFLREREEKWLAPIECGLSARKGYP